MSTSTSMSPRPGMSRSVEPCVDHRCPIHARGADPTRASALTCARQILRAYDRADAIALLEQASPPPDAGSNRVLLQLRSLPIAVGASGRLELIGHAETVHGETRTDRRLMHHFRAERIFLPDDAQSWRVDDVVMGGKSQIAPHGRLPAELFGHRVADTVRAFDRIARPIGIEIAVTRVGESRFDSLHGAVLGSATYEPRVLGVHSGSRVLGHTRESAEIAQDCVHSIEAHRFVIEDSGDWLIHDIRVDDRSLFKQPGDVPGEMFGAAVADNFVQFGVIRAGSRVRIHVSYLGDDPEGRPFVGEFRGQEPDLTSVG